MLVNTMGFDPMFYDEGGDKTEDGTNDAPSYHIKRYYDGMEKTKVAVEEGGCAPVNHHIDSIEKDGWYVGHIYECKAHNVGFPRSAQDRFIQENAREKKKPKQSNSYHDPPKQSFSTH